MSLVNTLFKGTYIRLTINNSKLTEILSDPFEKYAPLKSKKIKVKQVPLMNKKLSKLIMKKSRTRKKYTRWPSRKHFLALKKLKQM